MPDIFTNSDQWLHNIWAKLTGGLLLPTPDILTNTDQWLSLIFAASGGGGGGGLTGSGTPPEIAFWDTSGTNLGSAQHFEYTPGRLTFGSAFDTLFDFSTLDGAFTIGMLNSFGGLGINHENSNANILFGDITGVNDSTIYELNDANSYHKFSSRLNDLALLQNLGVNPLIEFGDLLTLGNRTVYGLSDLFAKHEFLANGGTIASFDNGAGFPQIRFGDISATNNNTNLFLDDLLGELNFQSLGMIMFNILASGGAPFLSMGDVSAFNNETKFEIDDNNLLFEFFSNSQRLATMNNNTGFPFIALGDTLGIGNLTQMVLDDTTHTIDFDATDGIKTSDPATGTPAEHFKIGDIGNGVATPTDSINIQIKNVVYRIPAEILP